MGMKVLVAREKHATLYYDASTPEKLSRVSLKILTRRMNEGWYVEPTKPDDDGEVLTKEQILALPERLQAQERDRLVRQRERNFDYGLEKEWYDDIKKVVDAQDSTTFIVRGRGKSEYRVPLTWDLLDQRADYEYESVELEELIE